MDIILHLYNSNNIKFYGKNVVTLNMEEYLLGVVAAEIGNAPKEACKAQAIVARTFALNKQLAQGYITDKSSIDQVFLVSRISSSYPNVQLAVQETNGMVLYFNGSLVKNANYCASNGGRTYSAKEVWGGEVLYLKSKKDQWDKTGKKNGHGVGMSQQGAIYAAKNGKQYKEILQFYYENTQIKENYGIQEKKSKTPFSSAVSAPVTQLSERTLKYGDSGIDVKELQIILNTYGFNLVIDGKYGEKTAAAVKKYQQQRGLEPDGICGRRTFLELSYLNLEYGDCGDSVKVLQKILGNLTVDGKFGEKTLAAVKKYQQQKGLTVNGIVDDKMWRLLIPA